MYVIGTAGHVDHGKSTLVRALTGIDPDRLREEKEREMTIDLGFAWLALPASDALGGELLGIVDVPGHRDFIENMLAGVGGIDAALFVVAADEGVMPQTREHLAILDLLGIPGGIIVLTKADLAQDEEWLELVALDVREAVQGTVLQDAPMVPVSARSGRGIKPLLRLLAEVLAARPPRADRGNPRLPVDRVFSISGFGTVVTGTLSGGTLSVGDVVEIQPGGLGGRVRGLQSYEQKITQAQPGSRVAVNVSGIDRGQVMRGQVLTVPGWLRGTVLADVQYRHLPDASRPLTHNAEVKCFSGAAESVARVRLLDTDELQPGQTGWLQIRLETSLALARGDRYILRFPSPGETIGGGVVIDPAPGRRWRRHRPEIIQRLEALARGTPAELAARTLERAGEPLRIADVAAHSGMSEQEAAAALEQAVSERLALRLEGGWLLDSATHTRLVARFKDELAAYHQANPLHGGMPREQLRSRLNLRRAPFDSLLALLGEVVATGADMVWLRDHAVRLTPPQQAALDRLRGAFAAQPYTPPSYKEALEIVDEALLHYLIQRGELVLVQADVLLSADVFGEFMQAVAGALDAQGSISARELRDRFNTTRKYAIGFLEYLDAQGITRREGDVRVRGKKSPA